MGRRKIDPEVRFWTKVNTNGPVPAHVPQLGACWVWTRGTYQLGYGAFRIDGRSVGAHTQSWIFHFGQIPKGMQVCHRCDNPPCVRPDHLFLGTARDNVRDMMSKGRGGFWRLTDAQVVELRERYATGEDTHALCLDYGIASTTASRIARGEQRPEAGGPFTVRGRGYRPPGRKITPGSSVRLWPTAGSSADGRASS